MTASTDDGVSKPGQARRWYQPSLGGLLLATALCALLLGWWTERSGTGVPRRTGRDLDVAIFGQGFFTVICWASGEICYTRHGQFSIDPNGGALVVGRPADGWRIEPEIDIPRDWTSIEITNSGEVHVGQPGTRQATIVGQIELAKFVAPEGLREVVPGIYGETDASGSATTCPPGTEGTGCLAQGWLETPAAGTAWPAGHYLVSWGAVLVLVWIAVELRSQRRDVKRLLQCLLERENCD